ncbi:MAG: polyphosphate:nucleotide phosphotransferase, family [Acidobacteria bacterium]|jgi:PPK2 family polyphosphate:nucleotide phosphotransferase|nr:polyphosphate:nucleotide phosphotransferase, family [Acidobacteriota bacterium]
MRYSEFIVKPNSSFSFKKFASDYTGEFKNEEQARETNEKDIADLGKHQDMLAAHEKYGLLVIFQGMDAAGKDPIIKHIFSGVDPQGCETKGFKEPTEKERRHDYLWRAVRALPARGQIGIFNRSYYEHVTVERVHPEKLEKWTLPDEAKNKDMWKRMYREMSNFEEYLVGNGIHVLKFFLHMSKEKQRERLLERIERTDKRHGFAADDLEDRDRWDTFMKYYEETIANTSTKHAPWYIIPDDHRWFAKTAVAAIVADKLKSFHSQYPRMNDEEKALLEKARKKLEKEGE